MLASRRPARRALVDHVTMIGGDDEGAPGIAGRRMISIVNEAKLRRILARMLDENEFFGPYGIRALSRFHQDHPFVFHNGGQ